MSVHLFNSNGGFIREGKNLAYVLRHAKNRAVKSIKTEKLTDSKHYQVFIKMTFNDGYYVVYNFASIELCNHFHSKHWNDLYKPIDL